MACTKTCIFIIWHNRKKKRFQRTQHVVVLLECIYAMIQMSSARIFFCHRKRTPFYLHTNDSMSSVSVCLSVARSGRRILFNKTWRNLSIFIKSHFSLLDINEREILNYDIHFLCKYQKEHGNSFMQRSRSYLSKLKNFKAALFMLLRSLRKKIREHSCCRSCMKLKVK